MGLTSPALLPELLGPCLDVPHPVDSPLLLPCLLEHLQELKVLNLPVPVPVQELKQLQGLLSRNIDAHLFEELGELGQGNGLGVVSVQRP